MSLLRSLFGTLRARLFGPGEAIPAAGGPTALIQCIHPAKALTACTYQVGPRGTYGWFYRCRSCLAWFSC